MEKIRAVYILLIGILLSLVVVLFLVVIGALAPSGSANTTAPQPFVSCIKIENRGFLMKVIIPNPEDRDLNYTYLFLEDNEPVYSDENEQLHTGTVPIRHGSYFQTGHFQSIDADQIRDVTLLVYREGESEPIENITCNFGKLDGNKG